MVNKTNKGNRIEKEARDILKEQGYLVEKKNTSRWESNDFWGEFDILAIRPNGSEVRLIQIKSNRSDFYKARKEIKHWVDENTVTGIRCEVWLRLPKKVWRKEDIVYEQKERRLPKDKSSNI